jgi:type IV pilus assembly protein PilP
MRYFIHSAIAICFLFTAAGCTSEAPRQQNDDATANIVNKKKVNKKAKAKAAEEKKDKKQDQQEYSYSSAGKPDPFRPLLADTSVKLKKPEAKNRAFLTPLQKYELSELKLVAVVVIDNMPTAMLEEPTGYGYVIRKGALIGPNEGVVERVTPAGLLVKEQFENASGEIETKVSTITIQQDE